GNYKSDLPYYINRATSGDMNGHRLIFMLFSQLYKLTDSPLAITIFLALEMGALFLANYAYIKYFSACDSKRPLLRALMQTFSIAAVFGGAIYVPRIHKTFYRNTFAIFAWHSPTQQMMTLLSVIATIFFFKMLDEYEEKIDIKYWMGTAVFMLLSAYAKPSYVLDIGPAIVIAFIIELFRKGELSFGEKFKKLFIMGSTLIPSGLYLMILNYIIYLRPDRKGNSNITVDTSQIAENSHFMIGICCCLAFPLLVTCFNWKKIISDRRYLIIALIAVVGILQWAMLGESGHRASHGNFGWGRTIGGYMFYITGLAVALENYADKDFLANKKTLRYLYFIALSGLLFLHTASQLYYFYTMYNGAGFWR
ncbi:MAG: hypothetical protein IJH57_01535, partial [Mogibacterium sp.]|nr:hypothetical protein [Mogibacterium sp.]